MAEQVCRSALPCPCDLTTLNAIELESRIGIQSRYVTSLPAPFFFAEQPATKDIRIRFALRNQQTDSKASNVRWRLRADEG